MKINSIAEKKYSDHKFSNKDVFVNENETNVHRLIIAISKSSMTPSVKS